MGWGGEDQNKRTNRAMYKVLLFAFASVLRADPRNVEAVEGPAPSLPNPIVHLEVGAGWTKFKFGEANTTVYSQFRIHNTRPAVLKLTDYFCSGDRFKVYQNGKYIGDTSPTVFDKCKSTTCDPDYAFYHEPWSHFQQALEPGHHNITLRVISSPYKEGYAAIRVDPMMLKCCLSHNQLTLIDTPVPYANAEHACQSFGMKLADVDVFNFNDATQVVFGCGGPSSAAYIKSYWGNTYDHSCLALYTGNAAPGGAISTVMNCNKKLPVLCQGETKSCHHHQFLRA